MAAEIRGVIGSGRVTKGPHLDGFEAAVALHLGVEHAVAVSSCTTGLMLTYRALGLSGDVIIPSFTFMATVSALVWAGAQPVFAEVDPDTWTLDSSAVEAAITPRTTGIVATHLFGNPANVRGLQAVAERHGLALVFDAAHGFGSLYEGAPVGRHGAAEVFSLSPTKLLIAGEGGIVATDDDRLAEAIRIGREYGNDGSYDSAFAGFNARMPEINAIMGLHSLQMLESAAESRNRTASIYRDALGHLPGIRFQAVRPGDRCSYKDFSLTVDPDASGLDRDVLARALDERNVDTRPYYDPPVHRHSAYREFGRGSSLADTDLLASRSLSLPMWSNMDDGVVRAVCDAVRDAWEVGAERKLAASAGLPASSEARSR